MTESALARLLRLKKEAATKTEPSKVEEVKENAPEESTSPELSNVPGTESATTDRETSSVALEGAVPASESKSENSDSNVCNPDTINSSYGVCVQKPLSAMDRIRAMRAGGSSSAQSTQKIEQGNESSPDLSGETSDTSSGSVRAESSISALLDSPESEVELTPEKPRTQKTHPLAMEMAELEEALNSEVPGFVSILSTIHKKLKADPNVVTLLDDDEIRVIVSGLERHTNVQIVAPAAVKASKRKAKEPVSAMDL